MANPIFVSLHTLIRKAPEGWLISVCEALRGFPLTASTDFVIQRMPATHNADLAFLMSEVIRQASGRMTLEALSWSLQSAFETYNRMQAEQHIELLWSGPSPANQIPARRIDQTLYDLIANAEREILLVTFAAAKIERLTAALLNAAKRGVKIRLILEFEESSEGQLSFDALKAFPKELSRNAEIYHWPVEKRERNQARRPGKLHAKVAIVDDRTLISSANLTDDAFNRNLEVGVMMSGTQFRRTVRGYFTGLIESGSLALVTLGS